MTTIDLYDFVLHGSLGPIHRRSHRSDLTEHFGPEDGGHYKGLAVFGPIAFDFSAESTPILSVQILIPRVSHERCPSEYFRETWNRSTWLDSWPDDRISCPLNAFVPGATFQSLCEQIPVLSDSRRADEWSFGEVGGADIYEYASGVLMFFEPPNLRRDVRILSRLMTGPFWNKSL